MALSSPQHIINERPGRILVLGLLCDDEGGAAIVGGTGLTGLHRRHLNHAPLAGCVPGDVDGLVATWDDYLETCKTIMSETGLSCFANSRANNDARLYEITLWQQGLGYYNQAGEVTLDSPENIATLEKLGEFWTAGVTSEEVPWTDGWYAELQSLDEPVAT
ncbi:MAG: hypothetical protein P8186_05490, partial [Anaerolineae bacterium]